MRAVNRVATALWGLALLAAGVLAVVEAVLAALGRPPWLIPADRWYATLAHTTYQDRAVLTVSVGVLLLGVVLLVAELRPWPPRRLAVRTPEAGEVWWVLRRPTERWLAVAAEQVTGVRHARVRLRGRDRGWRIRLTAYGQPDRRPELERVMRTELTRLAAPPRHRLRIRLRTPKGTR